MEGSRCEFDAFYGGFVVAVLGGLVQGEVADVHRSDDKTAEDYQLEGGATLHLVLALRGGC